MRSLTLYCLVATLLSIGSSVSAQNLNPLFRHLPPDAARIYHINLPAFTAKIPWEDLVSNIPPSKSEKDQEIMNILREPSQAGVDIHQDIFIAQTGGGTNKYDSATVISIIAHLTDSAKFIAFIRKNDKAAFKTINLPNKTRVMGKDKVAFAWNDKLAVVTIFIPSGKEVAAAIQKEKPGVKNPGATAAYTRMAAVRSAAALKGYDRSVYTTDQSFITGFSDDADFHMWAPYGEGASMFKKVMKAKGPMPNFPGKGTMHTLSALRFDAGKITMHSTTDVPADSAGNYALLNSRPLNTDLITRLPGKALLGMVNVHFDPSLLPDALKKVNLFFSMDSLLAAKGLTTSDITRAFKGDFLLAGMQPEVPNGKGGPDMIFVTTIGDLPSFMKLATKLHLDSDSSSSGPFGKMKHAYTLKDNILVIGRTKEVTDAYFTSAGKTSLDLVSERVRSNMVSVVLDAKAVYQFVEGVSGTPTPKTQQMLHFLGALDRLSITSGYQDQKLDFNFELKMADASENSLRSLIKLLH